MSDRVIKNNYLNLLYGLLLGKSFMETERRATSLLPFQVLGKEENQNKEIKLILKIEGKHIAYMKDIHKKISSLGYCDKVTIKTQILKKGNLNKIMKLYTIDNNNYLELFNKWYSDKFNKNIPLDIDNYFNEESLAYWLMTEGKINNNKLSVNMRKFNDSDIFKFIQFLENKFNLDKININNYWLEFNSNNIQKIYNIIKPYIFSTMKFKFISKY